MLLALSIHVSSRVVCDQNVEIGSRCEKQKDPRLLDIISAWGILCVWHENKSGRGRSKSDRGNAKSTQKG